MKKVFALVPVLLSLALPSIAFADNIDTCPQGQFTPLCTLASGDFGKIVGTVITLLFIFAAVFALGFLIWGGIKWILSGGDKTGVESARNTIVAAVVGLVIVFLSYFILNIVLTFFLGHSITNFALPTLDIRR